MVYIFTLLRFKYNHRSWTLLQYIIFSYPCFPIFQRLPNMGDIFLSFKLIAFRPCRLYAKPRFIRTFACRLNLIAKRQPGIRRGNEETEKLDLLIGLAERCSNTNMVRCVTTSPSNQFSTFPILSPFRFQVNLALYRTDQGPNASCAVRMRSCPRISRIVKVAVSKQTDDYSWNDLKRDKRNGRLLIRQEKRKNGKKETISRQRK